MKGAPQKPMMAFSSPSSARVRLIASPRPYAAYEELLVERFEITEDRARALRAILELYHRDLEELKSRHMNELEPDLLRAGTTCRDRIQRYVLTESQRSALADAGFEGPIPPSTTP